MPGWTCNRCPPWAKSEDETSISLTYVTQENEKRQRRNVEVLNPNAEETQDNWYVTQVSNHESLFPFRDNLTSLMFTVASDLSEVQRDRDSRVHRLSRE